MLKDFLTTATAPILAAIWLSACVEAGQTDADISPAHKPAQEQVTLKQTPQEPSKTVAAATNTPSAADLAKQAQARARSRYSGLDPEFFSEAEIDELIALQKEQQALSLEFSQKRRAWNALDPDLRGPKIKLTPRYQLVQTRVAELSAKYQIARNLKQYKGLDPKIISKAELLELGTLQQKQRTLNASHRQYRDRTQNWRNQNAIKPSPQMQAVAARIQELKTKINSARNIKRQKANLQRLSKTHNIALSVGALDELEALQLEQSQLSAEFQKAFKQQQALNPQGQVIANPRLMDINARIKAIKAPLEAAAAADRTRKRLTGLSVQHGVPFLSGEIEEAVELEAEKTRLLNQLQDPSYNALDTQSDQPIIGPRKLNNEDYARIQEIETRLKSISAPQIEAQNAISDAKNPAMKQHRLQQEKRQKWAKDWEEKKRSGEVPWNAVQNSPTFAEVEDRVKEYRSNLQNRAYTAGYRIPKADLNRLDGLNSELVEIRKKVYDLELGGAGRASQYHKNAQHSFAVTAGMHKVRLIEQKQQRILAGLTQTERQNTQNNSTRGQFSTFNQQQFNWNQQQYSQSINGRTFRKGQQFRGLNKTQNQNAFAVGNPQSGAEGIIRNYRNRGIEVSQTEADDLIAFERALAED